jgi:nucleoside-diphosphate-sugar epimerase
VENTVVTVVGASGFIGSAVSALFASRGARLRLVTRRSCVVPPGAWDRVEVRKADLSQPGQLADAVAGSDVVVPLVMFSADGRWRVSGGDEAVAERINVGVIQELADVLRAEGGNPIVVFPGSTSQVGLRSEARIDGSEPDDPATPYDRQKLAAERILVDATDEGVLRAVSLRLPTVFGPALAPGAGGQGVVTAMARRALAGLPLTVWDHGRAERDLLFVGDVAAAFGAAVDHADRLTGRHWPIGTGQGVTVLDLFTAIAGAVSARTGEAPVRVVLVPAPASATAVDSRSLTVDPSAFRAVTGWRPRVGLHDGLTRTVAALIADEL